MDLNVALRIVLKHALTHMITSGLSKVDEDRIALSTVNDMLSPEMQLNLKSTLIELH